MKLFLESKEIEVLADKIDAEPYGDLSGSNSGAFKMHAIRVPPEKVEKARTLIEEFSEE